MQRQVDELRKAGCAEILEETASGADRSRPVLARLLRRIRRGETLVVVKLDRLARSLEHLLEVVRTLEARGAFLRVLATRSTRRPRKVASCCRCWAPSPSSSGP